jgi:hypothetical protein
MNGGKGISSGWRRCISADSSRLHEESGFLSEIRIPLFLFFDLST